MSLPQCGFVLMIKMREDVLRQLSQSAAAFRNHIWPIIGPRVGGGELIHVEAVTEKGFKNDLDSLAGIDAWQVIHDLGIRGIASRVQPTDLLNNGKTWETFTIRSKVVSGHETEYAKRLRAVEHPGWGLLCPHLTIHSYMTSNWDKPLAIAAIRTRDLILFVKDHNDKVCEKAVTGGNHMLTVKWSELQKGNIRLVIWRHDESILHVAVSS